MWNFDLKFFLFFDLYLKEWVIDSIFDIFICGKIVIFDFSLWSFRLDIFMLLIVILLFVFFINWNRESVIEDLLVFVWFMILIYK